MSKKVKTTVAIVLVGWVCCWFFGIFCLYIFQQVLIMPALNRLEYQVHELSLEESLQSADDIYLMGLRMRSTPGGLSPGSSAPFFTDHRVTSISVFLSKGGTPAGNLVVNACPDKLHIKNHIAPPTNKALHTILFRGDSIFQFIDKMHNAKSADFSWRNLIFDARLVYILFVKGISTPDWYAKGRIYRVTFPELSGYLAEGKYGKFGDIKELTFAKNGIIYKVVILDQGGNDFREFLSSLRVVNQTEADEIIRGYSDHGTPRDIVLASRISSKLTIGDLEELLSLIEKHKSAGEKTVKEIGPLKAELEYLKGLSR